MKKVRHMMRIIAVLVATAAVFVCTACNQGASVSKTAVETTVVAAANDSKKTESASTTRVSTTKSSKETEVTTEKTSEAESTAAKENKTEKSSNPDSTLKNNSSAQSSSNPGNSSESSDSGRTGSNSSTCSSENGENNKNSGSSSNSGPGSSPRDSSSGNSSGSGTVSKSSTEKHTHSYTSQVVKETTCSEDGTIKYTCSCGDSYTETIPATGEHNWTGYEVIQEATCCQEEIYRETCSKCGVTRDVNSGYYTEHDWEERIDIGVKEVICSWKCNHCGQLFDTSEALILHQYRDDCHGTYGTYTWSTDPVYYCTVDGETANAMCNTDTAYGTIYVMLDCRYFCKDCGAECFPK